MFINSYQLTKIGAKNVEQPGLFPPLLPLPIVLIANGGYRIYKHLKNKG